MVNDRQRTASSSGPKNQKDPCGSCKSTVNTGIQCDECQTWFHTKCVNIADEQFKLLEQLQTTCWYCISCFEHRKERSVLSSMVSEVKILTEKIEKVESSIATPKPNHSVSPVSQRAYDDSYKYKVEIIGLPENDCKFPIERKFADKNAIENLANNLDVKDISITDCQRLGKFQETKMRPVTVTFSSVWDPRRLRSKAVKQKLYQHKKILILEELSGPEREKEKKLLAKRYELINKDGIEKQRTKIRNLKLYVDGVEHGL